MFDTKKARALHISLACLALAALATVCPSSAEAGLPGWGVDGSPHIDDQWCFGSGRTLLRGDFDGDGMTDILCHNSSTGRKRIDFSGRDTLVASGLEYRGFWGTDWDYTQSWCIDGGEKLFVGDFNGDGRDDLLCYANAGRKRIDFADSYGRFYGTDFDTQAYPSAAQNWCTNSGESIYVGDYNGDGKDDLLCHVAGGYLHAGRKRIDFANSSGSFWGTEFNSESYPSADQDWCTDAGESLHVGDFNGDGKDDLLCFVGRSYTNEGRRLIDFANSAGTFWGTNFNSQSYGGADQDWCTNFGDDRPMVEDFDGDGKDDLLCANDYYGNLRVDHANSNGTFFGTDGPESWENWCTASTESYHTGDFDGDGEADVLCHNNSSGYRGIRYANDAGDFYSVCSNGSIKGDGVLDTIPVHFVVVTEPNPNWPAHDRFPTSTSTHTNPDPMNPYFIDQSLDPSAFFRAEIDLMNARTYDIFFNPVCEPNDNDCVVYEYESHAFFDDISDTPCDAVLKYAAPPDYTYAFDCLDHIPSGYENFCFPTSPGSSTSSWNNGFAWAIRECEDPRINKPGAMTVVLMDNCKWDDVADAASEASCAWDTSRQSFGFGEAGLNSWGNPNFFTAWDIERVFRGIDSMDRRLAQGVEQHEAGHVLGLNHHDKCVDANNPMYRNGVQDPPCAPGNYDPDTSRFGGYSYYSKATDGDTDGQWVNQVDTMVTAAWSHMEVSCN